MKIDASSDRLSIEFDDEGEIRDLWSIIYASYLWWSLNSPRRAMSADIFNALSRVVGVDWDLNPYEKSRLRFMDEFFNLDANAVAGSEPTRRPGEANV